MSVKSCLGKTVCLEISKERLLRKNDYCNRDAGTVALSRCLKHKLETVEGRGG